jgi:hypothetical protein
MIANLQRQKMIFKRTGHPMTCWNQKSQVSLFSKFGLSDRHGPTLMQCTSLRGHHMMLISIYM